MDVVTQSIVIGLTENAPLVLAAIGFALLYKLTGLINVAYSETITLGAYFGMWINTTYGLDFYAVLIPTGLLAGVLSVATYLAHLPAGQAAQRRHARADHHLLRAVDLPAARPAVRLRLPGTVLRRPAARHDHDRSASA